MINAVELLLVEDNEDDAELMLKACSSHHYIHLKDGLEALDFVFARGKYASRNIKVLPKLIVLDLKLPKLDGIDVLRAIKQHAETHTIPVVILTSSYQPDDVQACYALGANSYIVKPDSFKALTEAAQRICQYWLHTNQLPG